MTKKQKHLLARIIVAAVLFAAGGLLHLEGWAEMGVYLVCYGVIGWDIVWKALTNILHGQVFDENFLMTIATVGALILGEHSEGVAVMLFYQVGEWFQSYAVSKSRRSITSLMDIRPDYANIEQGSKLVQVDPENVQIGDTIIVKSGERIPLDGKIIKGSSTLDTSALTGESMPREVEAGMEVISGCINQTGILTIQTTKEFGESTVAKILDLVENASDKKGRMENFITRFARYYTPAVVFAALALAILPPLVTGQAFSTWIYRALTFLVISCPCALVISIPLSFFGGIGGASKIGVLVKGSNYLEALAYTETVVFDKTGTLTKGSFAVTEIHAIGTVVYVAFVGDGINDAPVLARADVGIAMGALGSDAAIEAAGVVLMTDEPSKIAAVMQIARKTIRISNENIVFALGVKFLVLILGAMGRANMWAAVFADVGVSVIAILNAIRAMRVKRFETPAQE